MQERQHNLNVLRDLEDVYGADVWAVVKPTESEIIDMGVQSDTARRLDLWLESKYDLDVGYLVEVKRTRVLDGTRAALQTTLSADAAVGAVTLSVADETGFRSGDALVVWDEASAWEETRVRSVGTERLTLHTDCALQAAYSTGAVVRASRLYRVMDQRIPEDVGPYRVALLQHVASRMVVD